jgi:RNA polymerase sigma factor (sigma-70 family)
MDEHDWLAEQFDTHRPQLRTVAYRMLGSLNEADDAVQESWLRLSRSDVSAVENLGGWLTTVVGRVCLDMLRSRKSRREELGAEMPDSVDGHDPEHEAVLADSVGLALMVVLETLAPAERLAFVLHDMFALSFDEIAPIVGRSPVAARQLASRARRRVQGKDAVPSADVTRQREVVDAFLAASRGGDFAALLELLDPDVVVRADDAAARAGAAGEIRGAAAVAKTVSGRAKGARPALLEGLAGAVWAPDGKPRLAFSFIVEDGKIVEIALLAEAATLRDLEVEILGA